MLLTHNADGTKTLRLTREEAYSLGPALTQARPRGMAALACGGWVVVEGDPAEPKPEHVPVEEK